MLQTAERVSGVDKSDNYVFQRSILAYEAAAKLVHGRVLEIGTGEGYGISTIASKVDYLLTIDKFQRSLEPQANVEFRQMNIPPFVGIEDNSFDFVISFQVIEHIQNDKLYVSEIQRVLKPGGKFIVTTPNKTMSITRNPWHIREYLPQELVALLKEKFSAVEANGVFGNEKVMAYYYKNKESVRRITRFDIFNLQYVLPRFILQIPYDFLNRMNRNKLLEQNQDLTTSILMEDYSIAPVAETAFDLFYIATK